MTDKEQTTQGEVSIPPAPRRRRKRWWIAGAAVCAVALVGIAVSNAFGSSTDAPEQQKQYSTVQIDLGTLSGLQTVSGTLDYAAPRPLSTHISGVLTGVPGAGSKIARGDTLFTIDNVDVYLFRGKLPAWRAFERGMSDGPDIRQLEENLHALGLFSATPDENFDWETEIAVRAWQKETGQTQTGAIVLGRIVFAATDLRVAEVLAAIGEQVGPGTPIVRVSGLVQEVTANLNLADQKLGVVGTKVQLTLPGAITAAGTITAIGQPTEQDNGNGQKSTIIPITVVLDDPAAAKGIQKANVTVNVPSETRKNVLSVPISALLALPGASFGVEVVHPDGTTERIPVITGLFAAGRVEISSDNIKAGLYVAVPKQ